MSAARRRITNPPQVANLPHMAARRKLGTGKIGATRSLAQPYINRMRIFLLLIALPLWAGEDANAILRRYLEADKHNDEKAEQYTYVEEAIWFDVQSTITVDK